MTDDATLGLRLLDDEEGTVHRLTRGLLDFREAKDKPEGVVTSLDGSQSEEWHVGDPKHFKAKIHPDDLREPLVSWIGEGSTIEVEILTDAEDPTSGQPTKLRPVDSADVWHPGWTDHLLPVRLDPIRNS